MLISSRTDPGGQVVEEEKLAHKCQKESCGCQQLEVNQKIWVNLLRNCGSIKNSSKPLTDGAGWSLHLPPASDRQWAKQGEAKNLPHASRRYAFFLWPSWSPWRSYCRGEEGHEKQTTNQSSPPPASHWGQGLWWEEERLNQDWVLSLDKTDGKQKLCRVSEAGPCHKKR